MVCDCVDMLGRFLHCLGFDGFFEGGVGDEGIYQPAIHGIGGSLKGLELNGVVLLAAFEVADGLLADSHAGGQLSGAHAQGVADCSDPPSVWAEQVAWRWEILQSVVKPAAGQVGVLHKGRKYRRQPVESTNFYRS